MRVLLVLYTLAVRQADQPLTAYHRSGPFFYLLDWSRITRGTVTWAKDLGLAHTAVVCEAFGKARCV